MVVSILFRTFAKTKPFRPDADRIKKGEYNMYYVIQNDELGYILDCPTFTDRKEAESECAGKCRRHSVVETDRADVCRPMKPIEQCKKCPRWVKYKAK